MHFSDTDTLAERDNNMKLLFTVYLYKSDGAHREKAVFETKMGAIQESCTTNTPLTLIDGSDKFELSKIRIESRQSFLDYIMGGCQIGLHIAVDFTASNGLPHEPTSLHHVDGTNMNQYETAISKIANILQRYDADGSIPLYGFGAQVDGNEARLFAMNGNIFKPEVQGLNGVREAYRKAISSPRVSLHGPSDFGPFLKHITGHARDIQKGESPSN